jgi:hypothetical protein
LTTRLQQRVGALEQELWITLWHAYRRRLDAIMTPAEVAYYGAAIFDPCLKQAPLYAAIDAKIAADPEALQLNGSLGILAQRRTDIRAEPVEESHVE